MKVLIFGLGFIATHIALKLSEENEVLVSYRNLTPLKELYASILGERAKMVKVNPLKDTLTNLVGGVDAVINSIGALDGNLRETHVAVPKAIAKAIAEAGNGAAFIHISASNALGPQGNFVREEPRHCEGARPSSEYEETKCEGEKAVFQEAEAGGYPFAVIRPTLVYGEYAAHGEWRLMYKVAKLGFIPRIGLRVSSISAVDLARAVGELICRKPRGLYMYLTECEPVPIESLIRIMGNALGKRGREVPIPASLAMLALPSSVRRLAKYAGVKYDCSSTEKLLGKLEFRRDEVERNASFLRRLEEIGIS